MVTSIHKRDKAVIFSKVGAIIKGVLDLREIGIALGRLVKPIIFDLLNFGCAMAGKLCESADGIAFLNPELEPGKLVTFFDIKTFPDESLLASATLETSFANERKSVVFDVV